MTSIPAFSVWVCGPSSVMMWNFVSPSTTCTSSSPFGCRSQAPLPENLALKMLPSRNGVSVAKALVPFRSASVISGRRPFSIVSFPSSAFTSTIVITVASIAG